MGVTAHVLFYIIDGRMIMADTVSFDSLLDTTAGMTAVVNNTKHDEDVVSVTGVDWFTYAGNTASTIYVSGNNFIGFGQNAEQLKIWRRARFIIFTDRKEHLRREKDSSKSELKDTYIIQAHHRHMR